MPSSTVGRPAADDVRRREAATEVLQAGEHRDRRHAVRVEVARHRGAPRRPRARVIVTRLSVTGKGIDEHQGVVPVEQVVGQVHAADAVVDDAHLLRQAPAVAAAGRPRDRIRRRRGRGCRCRQPGRARSGLVLRSLRARLVGRARSCPGPGRCRSTPPRAARPPVKRAGRLRSSRGSVPSARRPRPGRSRRRYRAPSLVDSSCPSTSALFLAALVRRDGRARGVRVLVVVGSAGHCPPPFLIGPLSRRRTAGPARPGSSGSSGLDRGVATPRRRCPAGRSTGPAGRLVGPGVTRALRAALLLRLLLEVLAWLSHSC